MTNTVEATEKDFQRMMQMLTGFAVTQIIGAAAAYKIADHLAKGALSAKQIAAAEGISADATFRLLRACASLGLVTCDATLTFSATPLLSTLRLDVRGSLSNLAMAWAAPSTWLPSGRFADAVRTGERQTVPAIGAEFWDYLAQHPAEGAIFTSAIREAAGTVIDWFLAVSQSGVNDNARFICRINARRSAAIFGRPPSERDFQRQYWRKTSPMTTHEGLGADDRDDLQDRWKPSIQLDQEQAIPTREVNTTAHPPPQHDQLMSERSVLCLKSPLRLER